MKHLSLCSGPPGTLCLPLYVKFNSIPACLSECLVYDEMNGRLAGDRWERQRGRKVIISIPTYLLGQETLLYCVCCTNREVFSFDQGFEVKTVSSLGYQLTIYTGGVTKHSEEGVYTGLESLLLFADHNPSNSTTQWHHCKMCATQLVFFLKPGKYTFSGYQIQESPGCPPPLSPPHPSHKEIALNFWQYAFLLLPQQRQTLHTGWLLTP